MTEDALARLVAEIRGCTLCAEHLPLPPRPVIRVSASARLLIVGQAPSLKVHETGLGWNDASGDRLRTWLQLDRNQFYDRARVAILPMGFCYPGTSRNGDLPPRPECATRWRARLHACLPRAGLTLLVGQYAQRYYLGRDRAPSVTETVKQWRAWLPEVLPLPHPSPRNQAFFKRNPWFEQEVLPALRERLQTLWGDG